MGKKLFIGNLSFSVSDQILMDTFSQAGTVESAKVVTDRETGRSRGFGFVEMASDEEGQAAIEKFNGNTLEGRDLVVNEARPKEDRGNRSFGGNRDRFNNRRDHSGFRGNRY